MRSLLHWKTKTEEDWSHALIHESGHAVMAAMQAIRCYGVFLQQAKIKACTLVDPLPASLDLSNEQRLYLAAGSAAEEIFFQIPNTAASQKDRELFGNPQGITFDQMVKSAKPILLAKKLPLEKLASQLYAMVEKANGDFSNFRVQTVDSDGIVEDYWVLLDKEDLKEQLR